MSVLDWFWLLFVYIPIFIVVGFAYIALFIAPILVFTMQLIEKGWENLEKILDNRDS